MIRSIQSALLPALLLLWSIGCSSVERGAIGGVTPDEGDGVAVNVFFSQTSGDYRKGGGIDRYLVESIDGAHEEILLAIYAMTNDRIRDALLRAHGRGVDVRIVTDDKAYGSEDIRMLADAGIGVTDDQDAYALMHDKFMVIDRQVVWTGSCNYTYYAFYRNNENLVRIKSTKIAEVYRKEFLELADHRYIPGPYISPTLEIYFSPEDHIRNRVLSMIAHARRGIDFLAFAFTDPEIADALIAAKERGVRIRGVFDEKQNSYQKHSKFAYLREAGLSVYLDANRFTLHDKVMVIDGKSVLTGSYNFTLKANEENSENMVIVHNAAFAARYEEEFEKIYGAAAEANATD